MAENNEEEFIQKALFDLDYRNMQEKHAEEYAVDSQKFSGYAKEAEKYAKEAVERRDAYNHKTQPINRVSFLLTNIEKMAQGKNGAEYAQIYETASKYLDNLVQNGISAKEAADIKKGKEPEVDIDGSKKSFWGKVKNKVKNFWKPNNMKLQMENQIKELKTALAQNPSLLNDVKYQTSATESELPSTFKELAAKRDRVASDLHSSASYWIGAHNRQENISRQSEEKSQAYESKLAKIQEARSNVAREIALRAEARKSAGISDTKANTGVDRLADKAQAMEGMTPEQRLAYRKSQLRGTDTEKDKTVVKREINAQVMNKVMDGKLRA